MKPIQNSYISPTGKQVSSEMKPTVAIPLSSSASPLLDFEAFSSSFTSFTASNSPPGNVIPVSSEGETNSNIIGVVVPQPLECLQGTPVPAFLCKTFDLVDDPLLDPVISWGSTGQSFVVWDHVEFSKSIIPRNFKHNNFSSFVRQLNTYVGTTCNQPVMAAVICGNSKTLLIVNVCPNVSNLSETLSALNFAGRARNSELSLGNRDTIKKWKDVANDAWKELYEKEKEILDLKQEALGLKQALKDANDQCVLLFNEVQKAWKVSFTLQADLKSENLLLIEKHKVEKDQNAQLKNQVAHLLQLDQDQKIQIQQQDTTIQSLQIMKEDLGRAL